MQFQIIYLQTYNQVYIKIHINFDKLYEKLSKYLYEIVAKDQIQSTYMKKFTEDIIYNI